MDTTYIVVYMLTSVPDIKVKRAIIKTQFFFIIRGNTYTRVITEYMSYIYVSYHILFTWIHLALSYSIERRTGCVVQDVIK